MSTAQEDQLLALDTDVRTAAGLRAAKQVSAGFAASCNAKYGTTIAHYDTVGHRSRHGSDTRGARRRDDELPRLLVRHAARRGLRTPVPEDDPRGCSGRGRRPEVGRSRQLDYRAKSPASSRPSTSLPPTASRTIPVDSSAIRGRPSMRSGTGPRLIRSRPATRRPTAGDRQPRPYLASFKPSTAATTGRDS